MTSIHTDATLLQYFTPDGEGRIPAYHRIDLPKEGRREFVEALIDYYVTNEEKNHASSRRNRVEVC